MLTKGEEKERKLRRSLSQLELTSSSFNLSFIRNKIGHITAAIMVNEAGLEILNSNKVPHVQEQIFFYLDYRSFR